MRLHVGTSGYSYPEWKGSFYPPRLPQKDMLRYYAQRFSTVEINSSFYRIPSAALLEGWAAQVPAEFGFALKAPRVITHIKGLRDCEVLLRRFLDAAQVLGSRRGPLLFQLPGSFPKDAACLDAFLDLLPAGMPVAFEFRHRSWLDEEVLTRLRRANAALCIADTEKEPAVLQSTGDWGYLRLRRGDYGEADLQTWHARIHEQPWREAWVFFKHEEQGLGPRFAQGLRDLESMGSASQRE